MAVELPYAARLRSGQKFEIENTQQLRSLASNLKRRASKGSYSDDDLTHFSRMVGTAPLILRVSNPELSARAGLGGTFFSALSRDPRRVKLSNYLKALDAIIEVANERLVDIDQATSGADSASQRSTRLDGERLQSNKDDIFALAVSLEIIARNEIAKIDEEKPNDPDTIERNRQQRELLVIFAEGFAKIAGSLDDLSNASDKTQALTGAKNAVTSVADEVSTWWKDHKAETVDWTMRIPVFTAGVALLGFAGANMTVATTAIAALVGGPKIATILKRGRK